MGRTMHEACRPGGTIASPFRKAGILDPRRPGTDSRLQEMWNEFR